MGIFGWNRIKAEQLDRAVFVSLDDLVVEAFNIGEQRWDQGQEFTAFVAALGCIVVLSVFIATAGCCSVNLLEHLREYLIEAMVWLVCTRRLPSVSVALGLSRALAIFRLQKLLQPRPSHLAVA